MLRLKRNGRMCRDFIVGELQHNTGAFAGYTYLGQLVQGGAEFVPTGEAWANKRADQIVDYMRSKWFKQ